MNKILYLIFLFFFLSGCSYEPIFLNKNYDFKFKNINSDKEKN